MSEYCTYCGNEPEDGGCSLSKDLKAHVIDYWGKKCDDFDETCCLCQAWLAYEKAPLVLEGYIAQLDEANARLAMVSEALKQVGECQCGMQFTDMPSICHSCLTKAEALSATKADVEAWEFKKQCEWSAEQGFTGGVILKMEALEEQLATVTNERDALLELLKPFTKITYATVRLDNSIECRFLDGQKYSPVSIDDDDDDLAHGICDVLNYGKALAQKGGE